MPANLASPLPEDVVDLEEAQRFLDVIGAKKCTFQTFDDNAERKNPKLAVILDGKLNEHAVHLRHLNRLGAGIFVGLNQTDAEGRKKENVTRVRAVAVDLDGSPLEPVRECALKPHAIVETSPGRYHAVWRVKGLEIEDFEDVQRGIAKRFDGDPQIAMLTHVERLPGFYHRKAEPFCSRIIEISDEPAYTAEEIIAEFPPLVKPHRPPTSMAGRLELPHDDPLRCAMKFVERTFKTEDGAVILQFFRGAFYRWTGTHYAEIDEAEVRSKLYEFLKDAVTWRRNNYEDFKPNQAKVNGILDALKAGLYQSRDGVPPFWLEPFKGNPPDLIACNNGLLDLATRELQPHTPYLFNTIALPFGYDPDAPKPRQWFRFLRQLWPDDEEARGTLRWMFGYMLTTDTSQQKIFMLVGPKRSGKGTIAHVLTALLGRKNVVSPTFASLSQQFGLAALIDKMAAIIADARLGPRTDANALTERLLSLSGEDLQTVDRKYRDAWTGKFKVRFLILTNELPHFRDASGALASRFIVIILHKSFYGREDLTLSDRLMEELPGIFNWSLRGLDQLREDGKFKMPESSKEAIRQLEELASPVRAFVREWCLQGPGHTINVKELWDAYIEWCKGEGLRPVQRHVFGRDLHSIVLQLRPRGRGADRRYVGIALNDHGEDAYLEARRHADRYR